jgi:hypothetical protein
VIGRVIDEHDVADERAHALVAGDEVGLQLEEECLPKRIRRAGTPAKKGTS